jgi:hypothetical protein
MADLKNKQVKKTALFKSTERICNNYHLRIQKTLEAKTSIENKKALIKLHKNILEMSLERLLIAIENEVKVGKKKLLNAHASQLEEIAEIFKKDYDAILLESQ